MVSGNDLNSWWVSTSILCLQEDFCGKVFRAIHIKGTRTSSTLTRRFSCRCPVGMRMISSSIPPIMATCDWVWLRLQHAQRIRKSDGWKSGWKPTHLWEYSGISCNIYICVYSIAILKSYVHIYIYTYSMILLAIFNIYIYTVYMYIV